MKHLVVAAALAVSLATPGAALGQPTPAPARQPAPIDTFLEQRVVEELASDGIVLSRLEVSLDLELVGTKVLVSLVDAKTGRTVASTKIDELPADREAAVALATQVVANLATQLGAVPKLRPTEPRPAVTPPAPAATGQRERELAELRYRKEAIGFGDDIKVASDANGNVSTAREWFAFRGELRVRLEPTEFYTLLGRPDYADHYRAKHSRFRTAAGVTVGLFCGSLVSFTGGIVLLAKNDFESDAGKGLLVISGAAFVGTFVALAVAVRARKDRHPLSEAEAKGAAEQYNQQLRGRLGLPTAARERARLPKLRDVAWAPTLVGGSGAGFGVGGRF